MKSRRISRLDRGRRSPSIYSRTEEAPKQKSLKLFYYFLLLILLSILFYVVFYSPYFKIGKVKINDLKYVDKNKIEKEIGEFRKKFINNNLLTFNSAGLIKKIGEMGEIKSVKVSKKLPNELNITITEKTPVLVWETVGKKYLIEENGVITSEYDDKYKDFPTVIDTKNIPVIIGKQIVTKDFCEFVTEFMKDYSTYTNAKIIKIEIPEITSELRVTSDQGWYVSLDTTRTAKGQLISLQRVLIEAKSKGRNLEYVDLRVDSRIFYK